MHAPCRECRPSSIVAVAIAATMWLGSASAQLPFEPDQTGPLFRVQGHRYERRVFDPAGELKGRQTLVFDWMRFQNESCLVPVNLKVYDGADFSHLRDEYEIRIQVECAEPHLVASVLASGNRSGSQSVEVRVFGEGQTYPPDPRDGQKLPEVHWVIRLRQGVLSMLGTRTELRMSHRRVRVPAANNGHSSSGHGYEVLGDLETSVYMLGIRWKRELYRARQVIGPDQTLVEETLRRQDGTVTELTAVTDP